ncbi:MAG: hypothetical protein LBC73_10485 [Oscillospiraceae bacterium]|jgi:hypothetical protein|nr:hypothetical protein [Oscillospiraceae bacterium]
MSKKNNTKLYEKIITLILEKRPDEKCYSWIQTNNNKLIEEIGITFEELRIIYKEMLSLELIYKDEKSVSEKLTFKLTEKAENYHVV